MRNQLGRVLGLLLCVSGCASTGTQPRAQASWPAPAIALETLDGSRVTPADWKGKVVLLDFWATWCPPCLQSLPHLQSVAADAQRAQSGLVVLAVDEEEKPATIRAFLQRNHFSFTVLLDPSGLAANSYKAGALPTTIVVGRDGLVRSVINGWTENTAGQIDDAVARALDQK